MAAARSGRRGRRRRGREAAGLASLRRDREWVAHARDAAFALVDGPGGLDAHPQLVDEVDLVLRDDDQEQLLKG